MCYDNLYLKNAKPKKMKGLLVVVLEIRWRLCYLFTYIYRERERDEEHNIFQYNTHDLRRGSTLLARAFVLSLFLSKHSAPNTKHYGTKGAPHCQPHARKPCHDTISSAGISHNLNCKFPSLSLSLSQSNLSSKFISHFSNQLHISATDQGK